MKVCDRLITFSEFDIFAYLVVGLVLLAVFDLLFNTDLILRRNWGFGAGVMIVVIAYVLGHLVSIPGHWFIEEGIAKRILNAPRTLVSDTRCPDTKGADQPKWFDVTILAHDAPLSCAVLEKLKEKLANIPVNQRRDDGLANNYGLLLEQGLLAARSDPYTRDRMQIFLRLYVFSRNMACVALFGALAILIQWFFGPPRRATDAKTNAHPVTVPGDPLPREPVASASAADATAKPEPAVPIPNWLNNRFSLFAMFLVFGVGLHYRHVMFLRLYDGEALTAFALSAKPFVLLD